MNVCVLVIKRLTVLVFFICVEHNFMNVWNECLLRLANVSKYECMNTSSYLIQLYRISLIEGD